MSNICFVPARNSSTRLRNKNTSKFGKGNLITHTIEQAIESNIFDSIVLSSNDENILDIGKNYPVELDLRSDKYDRLIDVIRNYITLDAIDGADTLCLLLVTCPLRSVEDIQEAHRLFTQSGKKYTVVSVKENENPIQMSFKIDGGGFLIPMIPDEYKKTTRKQDHQITYFYNDAAIFDLVGRFMDPTRNLFGHNPIPYVMPWERSVSIDYGYQLKIVRLLEEDHGEI
jgi:CMP-N-acetylneuraminic acid synthetase